jgi:hypothetical protein
MFLVVKSKRDFVGAQKVKKYAHLREKAIQLRKEKHLSLNDIVDRLQLPKTTVYYWIKDIPIPRTNKQTESQRRGTLAMQEKYERLREEAYQSAYQEASELLQKPTFRDFVVLYMAEGYKRDRNLVSVANSDTQIVKLVNYWITKLTNNTMNYSLQCHADHDEDELKAYWSHQLNISVDEVRVIRKSNSGQLSGRQWRSKYGVLTVRVGDTYLRSKLQAWMDYLQKSWRAI